jgi:hypothetical protein
LLSECFAQGIVIIDDQDFLGGGHCRVLGAGGLVWLRIAVTVTFAR